MKLEEMKYYLIAFLLSLVLFAIIQFIEYNNSKNNDLIEKEQYSLFTLNNLLLFVIIFIVITIASFYLSPMISNFNFNLNSFNFNQKGGNPNANANANPTTIEEIDPKILAKINDNFEVGFEPFNSDVE